MEYYTYGGFEQIVGAFTKIALIFSDSGFKAAIFVAMVGGILFGGIALVMRAVGGRFSTLSWGVPLMAGYLIYAAMIVPQGTLYIYDPVANRNQAVGGIPDGIVFIAGTMNEIEQFMVTTIYTASDPMSYENMAGGRGFNVMYDIAQSGGIPVDADIAASLKQYTNDCVMFELQRPGTTLTVNGLATSTDFMSQFALAASPSIYTVEYPGNTTASCQAAWTVLSSELTSPATYSNAMNAACANAGYHASNASELTQCTDTLAGVVNALAGGTGYAASDVFKQMLIGQTMNDVLLDNSPSLAMTVLANRNTGSSLIGAGMAANEWLPVFKAVMTAVGITLIPFLVIFLPTPLAKKALYLICGIFVYITAWGVIDAIIHSMAMDYAMTTLSGIITQGQLGMLSLNFFSTGPAQVLAVMGGMRWGGMMLAGAVSATFVGVGGSVLGQMAASAVGTAQRAGSASGMTVGTPEGMAKQLSATETAPITMANAAKYRYSDRVNAGMAQKFGATESGMELVDTFGGVEGASAVYRQMNTGKAVRFGAGGAAAESMGLTSAYSANTFGAGAQLGEVSNLQTMFGNDPQSLANTRTAPQQTFNDVAAARGMRPEELASTLATRDVVANADTIMKYARARGGISPHQAAGELGEIAASQNYVNAASYDKARGVTGEEGQIRTRTNENLNEAAKFAVFSKLAQNLGIAKDDNDFKGMYDLHKQHHGEDSLTLSNLGAVSRLNQRMKEMGYSTRFKAGDRIRVNFDEQGNIESAFAVRGASREGSDITSEIKGYESNYLNVRRQTTGFRGEHGFMDTSFNYKRTIGTGLVEMGKDAAGKPIYGPGFREAYFDRKTGELAAETWTNKRTGQFTGVEYIDTGRKDPGTGKPIKAPQWVTGTMELDKSGSYVVKDFRSVSNEEVVRGDGKFVSEMKVDAGSGLRLYEVGRGGQDMARVNKLVLDEESEARFTIAGGVLADDKSQVTANQESVLWVGAGLEKGVDMAAQARQFRSVFQKPGTSEQIPGGSPTSKDMEEFDKYFRRVTEVRNQKAAHSAGNYGVTLPSPAQPKATLRPKSVETRYPD